MIYDLKLYETIGVPLLELIVRNIARYPQSATSMPIRYKPAIRYLVPWARHIEGEVSKRGILVIAYLTMAKLMAQPNRLDERL
jgi:hypothetical protein